MLAPGTVSVSEDGRLVAQTAFTPMLPGDDQLVAYGEDSTLSIAREVESSSTISAASLYWRKGGGGGGPGQRRRLSGAKETHEEVRKTTYTIKNNATAAAAAPPTPLYIDHEACASHGGYVIRSSEHAIKSTSSGAFTRYRFVLAPQEEVRYTVEEHAQHFTYPVSAAAVRAVLASVSDPAVLSAPDRATLETFVAREERKTRLRQVEETLRGKEIPERTLHGWRASGGLPETILNSLDGLHALQAKRKEGVRQKGLHQTRIGEVFTNQDRLRENIKAFEKIGSNELLKRYLSDMGREEDELIAVRAKIATLDEADARLAAEVGAAELTLSAEVAKLKEELDAPMEEREAPQSS